VATRRLGRDRRKAQGGETRYSAIREAVASGHGIGKSALIAWLIKWSLDTFEDTKVVVTANTEKQLQTKTWPELAKWHRLSITSPLVHVHGHVVVLDGRGARQDVAR
jgi:hypothetical protein